MGPVVGTIAAVVGAGAAVAGTIGQNKASKKAAAATKQQQALEARRARRAEIREFQKARATALATAQGAGALQSSGVSGGIGSLSSQFGANAGFNSQFSALSDIITTQNQKAVNAGSTASLGGTLLSFGLNQGAFQGLKQVAPNRPPQYNFTSAFTPGAN